MRRDLENYLVTYFDEIEPLDFYRLLFSGKLSDGEEAKPFAYHGTIIRDEVRNGKETHWHYKIWSDLQAIEAMQGLDGNPRTPPAAYIGFHNWNKNARFMFAIAVDLDFLTKNGIQNFFGAWCDSKVPRPTWTVWSGNGLHLYYKFAEPVPCYEYNLRAIKRYKTALTRKIWNAYITEKWGPKEQQIEATLQPMRIVGAQTKDGGIVRAFDTCGGKYTTEKLDSFVDPKDQIGRLENRAGVSIEIWAQIYPEWYQARVIEKTPRGHWVCNRGLYDWWHNLIKTAAVVNHRYFAVMALAIFAVKCGIDRKELERDAYNLIPLLDSLTAEENNHFTIQDVKSALRAYDTKYCTFPREWIETLTAIQIPKTIRKGRPQAVHLKMARKDRDILQEEKGRKWTDGNGRKPKAEAVQAWRAEHPEGTKKQCKDALGLSYPTIRKWWEGIERETIAKTQKATITAEDLERFETETRKVLAAETDKIFIALSNYAAYCLSIPQEKRNAILDKSELGETARLMIEAAYKHSEHISKGSIKKA